ncbi:MAG: rhodanese-like domain-containing protein [Austwickia sp.]|jgi:rhodanese-related sulfurtransferase|nr:MAG: rhodanese-like domain-containing protein [Austwickia sp.]
MTNIPVEPQPDVPAVNHDDLPDNAQLVDVRERDEWDLGHAPDAIHVPLSQIESRLDELPTYRPLVIVCRSGARSGRVVAFLNASGYDAVNLTGGMLAWKNANRPLTHLGSGTPEVR